MELDTGGAGANYSIKMSRVNGTWCGQSHGCVRFDVHLRERTGVGYTRTFWRTIELFEFGAVFEGFSGHGTLLIHDWEGLELFVLLLFQFHSVCRHFLYRLKYFFF